MNSSSHIKSFFLFFGILFFSSCSKENEKKNSKEETYTAEKIKTVSFVVINEQVFNREIIANGKVISKFKSAMNFNTTNKLTAIKIKNGQKVVKGELLASIENSLLKNNLEKTRIDLSKANNKLIEEKINFGIDIKKPSLEKLKIRSGLLEAQNNLERAQIEYNQTFLRAPFTGVIANIEKKEGDFITSSDIFCLLINPNNLEVSFLVLENELQFISKSQEIEIQSFVNKDELLKGIITEINPLVDKNGLIKIKAKILSKETNIFEGMTVKVFINKPLKNVIVIPKEALVLRSNKEVVFTIEKGLAKWNYVEVVGENNNSYAIKKSLKVSDTIIVSGNMNLSHYAEINAIFLNKEVNKK